MKLAILSDIHGNQYALRAMLTAAREIGVTSLILLGDYIGYYFGIKEVLDLICQWDFIAIKGNHEVLVKRAISDSLYLEELTLKYGSGHAIALRDLSSEKIDWLFGLPESKELTLGSKTALLCHGTPWDFNEYVYPDAGEETLKKFDMYEYDFIFYGHTHYSTWFRRSNLNIINPGSVGQSREKGGIAFWGLYDTVSDLYTQMKTPYSTKELLQEVEEIDPQLFYNREVLLRNNRGYDR